MQTIAYVVVHTIGSDDTYPDVARFDCDPDAQVDYSYTDALDCAHEIRAIDGHYARIDAIHADGSRVIR